MTKAIDPFFACNIEPVEAARRGAAITPSDTVDLVHVTSTLIITIGSGGTGINVIFAGEMVDSTTTFIGLAVGTYQINAQVRRILSTGTSLGTGGSVVALWS